MADEQTARSGELESTASEPGDQTFEEALERLEEVVRLLESGDLELDRSLLLFQEGIGLARFCAQKLDDAESKIEMLVEKTDGTFDTVPLDGEPEAEL